MLRGQASTAAPPTPRPFTPWPSPRTLGLHHPEASDHQLFLHSPLKGLSRPPGQPACKHPGLVQAPNTTQFPYLGSPRLPVGPGHSSWRQWASVTAQSVGSSPQQPCPPEGKWVSPRGSCPGRWPLNAGVGLCCSGNPPVLGPWENLGWEHIKANRR